MDPLLKQWADLYKALSEETRLEVLAILNWGGELCVCDIEAVLEITQSKASRHLRYLYHAGLVQSRREGVWTYYRLPEHPGPAQAEVLALVRSQLTRSKLASLHERLQRWLVRKRGGRPTCHPR